MSAVAPTPASQPSRQGEEASFEPASRINSLIYRPYHRRSNSRNSGSDNRPRQTEHDKSILRAFAQLNGLPEDSCWVTGQAWPEGVHMIPHSEQDCTRMILWFQLMGLLPERLDERSRWKVSPRNLIPLSGSIHKYLADGKRRRALLRPTRSSLEILVRLLEEGIARDEAFIASEFAVGKEISHWKPDWEAMVEPPHWPHTDATRHLGWNAIPFQFDIFDFKERSLYDFKRKLEAEEAPGARTYPNTLTTPFEPILAPLCILTMVPYSVSQISYLSALAKEPYTKEFLEDLQTMSYIVNILASPYPGYFRNARRPDLGFPRPPRPSSEHRVPRQWVHRSSTRSSATNTLPDFSSSPAGCKVKFVDELWELRGWRSLDSFQAEAYRQEGASDDDDNDADDSEPGTRFRPSGLGASTGRATGSQSSGDSSNLSGLSLASGSMSFDSLEGSISPATEPIFAPLPCIEEAVQDDQPPEESHMDYSDRDEAESPSVVKCDESWQAEGLMLEGKIDSCYDEALRQLEDQLKDLSLPAAAGNEPWTVLDRFLLSTSPLPLDAHLAPTFRRLAEREEEWEMWIEQGH